MAPTLASTAIYSTPKVGGLDPNFIHKAQILYTPPHIATESDFLSPRLSGGMAFLYLPSKFLSSQRLMEATLFLLSLYDQGCNRLGLRMSIEGYVGQVCRRCVAHLPGYKVLSLDPHTYVHGGLPGHIEAGFKSHEVSDEDWVKEVQTVYGRSYDIASRMAVRYCTGCIVNELHDYATMNVASSVRVLW